MGVPVALSGSRASPLARDRRQRYLHAMSKDAAFQANSRAVAPAATRKGVKRSRVKFGGITVVVPRPSTSQVKQNVAASSLALERASKRFVKPGVRLSTKKGVPHYSADPERPGVYIRTLDGKRDRGVLKDGVFTVID